MLNHIEAAIAALPYPTQPEGLYEPIAYALEAGGKRIRPLLLLTTYALYRSDWEAAISAAVGIEMYHNHTLLHDDVMDAADLRRGRPTVHKRWNNNTAILSGDAMLLLAYRLLGETRLGRYEEALALFTKSALEICEGQQFDVNFESQSLVTEADYIEMIRLKTSVLLGCAVKVGALLADAPPADADALYAFAERIGLAFQLQDDWLDAFGSVETFGKRIGGDIMCGKKTFLVHAACAALSSAEERASFLALLASQELSEGEKIARVMEVYERCGVSATCQARITQYFEEAHQLLACVSVDTSSLWALAAQLLRRNH